MPLPARAHDDVKIERLADGAGLLCTVEYGDFLHALRQNVQKMLDAERPVQADLDEADLFALRAQVIDDFLRCFTDRAHRDNDIFGIGCAVIVKRLVIGADFRVDLIHVFFDDRRKARHSSR